MIININNNNIDNLKYRFVESINNINDIKKSNYVNTEKISNEKIFDKLIFYNKITNELVKNNECPNFIIMYGYDKLKLNILSEQVEGTLLEFLKNDFNEKIFISGLFQIFFSILILQKNNIFHSQLNIKNIFYKKINKSIKYFQYKIDLEEYTVPTYGYLFIIGNFSNAQKINTQKYNNLDTDDIKFAIDYNYDFDTLKSFENIILKENTLKIIYNYDILVKYVDDIKTINKVYLEYKKKYSSEKLLNKIIDYCIINNLIKIPKNKIIYKTPSTKVLKLTNIIFESKNDISEMLKEYFGNYQNITDIKNNEIKKFNFPKKNIKNQISRNQINNNQNYIDQIKKLYQVNKFNYSTSKYFYLLPNRNFTPKFIKPMYQNIEAYDFIEPIKKLNLRFQNTYYNNLINFYDYKEKTKLNLYNSNKLTQIDLDEIMLQYIKCRNKCFVITLWPVFTNHLDKIVEYLESKGNVYYTKYIDFEPNGLMNYLISVYDEFSNEDILKIAKNKYSWSRLPNQTSNKIAIIIFDNVNNLGLSGQASIFKTELRKWAMGLLKSENINLESIRGNDLIHINDYFYQTIEYCELLLNSNSINLLNNRLYSNIYDKYFETTHLKIETYRKIIYSNLSLETINSLFLIAGVSLFFYGFRPISDLDGICINMDSNYKNKSDSASDDIKKITQLFCDEKTRLFYIEFGTTNTEYWKDKWTQFNSIIANYFGISNFNDICWNPNYHYYFKGIKCYLIDFEFYKKLQRSNEIVGTGIWPTLSKDYTDYIMINYLNPKIIEKYIYINKSDGKLTVSKEIVNIYPKLINPLPFNEKVLDLINKFLISKYKPYLNNDINDDYIKSLF